MAIGKISGPLLKENLLREGIDLAFETDLIYLDVNNRRVGIRTSSPTHDLTVNGTTRTTNLEVTNSGSIGNIIFDNDQIYSTTGTLNLYPDVGNSVIYQSILNIDDLQLQNNTISNTSILNPDINITPNGSGSINLNSNTLVTGNLHATGTITADGNLTIGDANTDNVIFNADVASNVIPDLDNVYQLGTTSKRWKDVYVTNLIADTVSGTAITIGGIDLTLSQGNIYYVATNGDDGNSGIHQNDPLSSVGRALDLATAGDTVYIYPGTYQETLPLTIPAGVTVRGAGLRSVTIEPDSDVTVDVFLLNGETTVEDLTIKGFEFDSGTNTGYAFRFAPGCTVTTRSPYIRNVTVLTFGSTVRLATNPVDDPRGFLAGDAGKGAYIDGSVVDSTSKEASMLFHSVTFICPGVDAVTMTNGVRVEWLNCFTYFANKGLYAVSGSLGFASDGKTRVKIATRTGTFAVGNTLSYYDTDGVTILASGVIESIDGDFFVIDGKVLGFETITDRPGKTVYVQGNSKLSTSIKKYGVSSLALDGVGDYINVNSQADFEFGTGDFALEGWIYRTVGSTYQVVFDMRTTATDIAVAIGIDNVNRLYVYVNGAIVIQGTTAVTASVFEHVALSRSGTSLKLFLNGVQEGTTYTDTNNYAARPVKIGTDYAGLFGFTGNIDDVRISKGVPRYTGPYSPPAAALTGDLSTVLLLHFEGPNNSTNIIDDGVTLQDIRTSAGGTASFIDYADYNDFGAEIRSIASAAIYGNYGAYGDGDGVIGYLIGTNFAYIGAGRFSNNDPNVVTQANEIVELNRAHLYYVTVDHKGDFRVGDFFYVNQETGDITFNSNNLVISSPTGVTFTNGLNITTITGDKIETGNIRISGNTIESTIGNINLSPADNQLNLLGNTSITGFVDVTNNLTVNGNTTLGDSSSDSVTVNARINSDLIPSVNAVYNLGSITNNWNNVYLSIANIDNITITGNSIRTTTSNSDLELRANGTGIVNIPSDSLYVNQNLTVSGNSNLQSAVISGNLTATNITTPNPVSSSVFTVGDITVSGNTIRTTLSNSNLELSANGTGLVLINDNLDINNNLTVYGTTSLQNTTVTGTLTSTNVNTTNLSVAATHSIGDIQIAGNVIQTVVSNSNLELKASGSGIIDIQNSTAITGNLSVGGTTTIQGNTTINGILTVDTLNTSNISISGTSNFLGDIEISGNRISTIVSNANLELRANGSGIVSIPSDSLYVSNNLTVSGTTYLQNTNVIGTITSNTMNTGNLNVASTLNIDQIQISGNLIRTTNSNANLELRANGSGIVSIPSDSLYVSDNLTVSGTTYLQNTNITGTVTSNTMNTGNLNVASTLNIDQIQISGNVIRSTASNANLELRTNGTGTVELENFSVNNSTISGTAVGQDITLTPSGTGIVNIDSNQSLKIPVGTEAQRPAAPQAGMIRFNTSRNQYEGYNGSYWIQLGGVSDVDGNTYIIPESSPGANDNTIYFYTDGNLAARLNSTDFNVNKVVVDSIEIDGNVIRTSTTNTDLEFRPNGTGRVVMDNFKIGNNTILNTTPGATTELQSTGSGYYSIPGTTAVVIPSGGSFVRPLVPTQGMMRFNTDFQYVEVYTGTTWASVAGLAAGINLAQAQDVALAIVLSLG